MHRAVPVAVAAVFLVAAIEAHATDFLEVCRDFAESEAVFIGRAQPAVHRRISFESEIDKARAAWESALGELERFKAQKLHPSVSWQRALQLEQQLHRSREEYDRTRAMYPPPADFVLTPMEVEKSFRGVSSSTMFVWMQGLTLETGRSYLVYGFPLMGPFVPDVVMARGPTKDLNESEQELRILEKLVTQDAGPVLYGSLRIARSRYSLDHTPLAGVPLHLTAEGRVIDLATRGDGTFMVGVPPGELKVEVDLPPHLTLVDGQTNPSTIQIPQAGCPTLHFRAALNGRISGRTLRSDGIPFHGIVELLSIDPSNVPFSGHVINKMNGEFSFSGVPPGTYLVGVNITRPPSSNAAYPPTYFPGVTERDQATPIVLGAATEHEGIEIVLGAAIPKGEIELTLDTGGRNQKTFHVCVEALNGRGDFLGGVGYDRDPYMRSLIIPVVEGVRYRIAGLARTDAGYEYSRSVEFTGAAGRQRMTLTAAASADVPPGNLCAPVSPK